MASRKELKKNINYIAGELFTECLVKKADELMAEILKMQDEFISRISHTEPGNVKGFYKKLRADFNAKVDEMKWVGLMNNISNCANEIVLLLNDLLRYLPPS